jgi:hypothetical protein
MRLMMRSLQATLVAVVMAGSAPVANAVTGDEMCKAMHWPMPLPPTIGWSLTHMDYDSVLSCFQNLTATAPDGHDTMNDPANQAHNWKVTSMTPPAGTMVPMDQKLSLTVVWDPSAPS